MIKDRRGSGFIVGILMSLFVVSSLLLFISKTAESNIRYVRVSDSIIEDFVKTRNKDEKFYTYLYMLVNKNADDEEIMIEKIQKIDYLGIKHDNGPELLEDNKYLFRFNDSSEEYEYIIDLLGDHDSYDVYRIY